MVGEIPGAVTPDEVVLVSGHLDSWGLGTGAIDDGAGVAITLAAAHLAGERHPRRTIRMVMWGAEETDYAGEAYAKAHAADASKIVVAGESDNGAQHDVAFQVPAGGGRPAGGQTLAEVLKPIGVTFSPEPVRFGGDDIGHLVPPRRAPDRPAPGEQPLLRHPPFGRGHPRQGRSRRDGQGDGRLGRDPSTSSPNPASTSGRPPRRPRRKNDRHPGRTGG
ncbi:MAG: M28 family peptidase [Caulobacteraceae bacterium]